MPSRHPPRIQIDEVCRSLAEFYPDPEERRKIHYFFCHRFFRDYFFRHPTGVVRDPDEAEDATRYVQARWQMMEQALGLQPPPSLDSPHEVFRRVNDLRAERRKIGAYPALVVEMPAPEHPVQAYLFMMLTGCPIVDPTAERVGPRFFTLERLEGDASADPRGVLCEWDPSGRHDNFTRAFAANVDDFALGVVTVIERGLEARYSSRPPDRPR